MSARLSTVVLVALPLSAPIQSAELSQLLVTRIDPMPIERIEPKYPINAARQSREGWVRLSFVIDKEGNVGNVLVTETSGSKDLTQSAIKAAKEWKYEPAMENGQPVQQCANSVQMDFRMHKNGTTGVSRKFKSQYKKAQQALAEKDYKVLDEQLALMKKDKYSIHSKKFVSVNQSIKEYKKIINKYKIKSIEDPFGENDWVAWNKLMKNTNNVQIVGDDLYVTNLERLKKGFLNNSSNSILIKLNQIGTVSETLEVIKFAQIIGYKTIISHRSGDSEDTFIADLAVGTNSNQIKTGSLARSERVAKYNQLLRIEEELGKKASMSKIH